MCCIGDGNEESWEGCSVVRISSICLILFGMWVALVSSVWAQATPGYTIHQVTFPGSFATYAWGVNDQKHVVGSYIATDSGPSGLFLRVGGSYKDLDAPRFIPFD